MRLREAIVTLVALAAASRPAAAQIVNVQPLVGELPRPGLSAALEASLDWRTGNTTLLMVSGSAMGRYRVGPHLFFLLGRIDYGEKSAASFVNHDLEHARWRLTVRGPFEVEAFVQHERDEFRRLAVRQLGGAGVRGRWEWRKVVSLAAGVAYMLEYEQLARDGLADAGQGVLAHRLSSYAVLSLRLAERLFLVETVYLQPRLPRAHDTRVLSEAELLAVATKGVGLKLTFAIAWDSEPPIAVKARDTAMKGTLVVTF